MITRKELEEISNKNRLYIDTEGKEGEKANLSGRDLSGTNLSGLYFKGADLSGLYFKGADLSGTNLRRACLEGAKLDYQIQEGLLQEIAEKILANVEILDMEDWHSKCGTIHCIAGWACELNPVAKKLEEEVGTPNAALLTLGHEAHSHFYDSNEDALKYLKSVLEK